ncbi:hypothetical protein HZC30_01045 [Candidatus Woesearchaeota archaeon]|nr:hypothetical protein [Candidatus Woesearchaeota archaeon]
MEKRTKFFLKREGEYRPGRFSWYDGGETHRYTIQEAESLLEILRHLRGEGAEIEEGDIIAQLGIHPPIHTRQQGFSYDLDHYAYINAVGRGLDKMGRPHLYPSCLCGSGFRSVEEALKSKDRKQSLILPATSELEVYEFTAGKIKTERTILTLDEELTLRASDRVYVPEYFVIFDMSKKWRE